MFLSNSPATQDFGSVPVHAAGRTFPMDSGGHFRDACHDLVCDAPTTIAVRATLVTTNCWPAVAARFCRLHRLLRALRPGQCTTLHHFLYHARILLKPRT